MRVTVVYCPVSNYLGVAQRLDRDIREEFPVSGLVVELVPAKGGVFEVSVNDRLVFSKRATWRLPDSDEIFYHVRAALRGREPGPPAYPSTYNST